MTSAVIYKNCNLGKQFERKYYVYNKFLGGNILMFLAIIKSSLVPVISYNKFKHFQKTDSECKSQDICQELTVTSEVILK